MSIKYIMLEICTCHYNEDLEWLENCGYPINIVHKEGGTLIESPTFTIPNVGCEVSAYLKFIIERYDTLPDHVAFLHGHETSYHQLGDRSMLDMIRTANTEKYNFIELNNCWRCCSLFNHFKQFKEKLQSLEIFLSSDKFITCCGAQFIVSRSCIQRHTKEYYENLFKNIITQDEAVMMEHIWHFIFTGNDSIVPHDDDFNPPIKEILYSTGSCVPLYTKDIKICYIGKQVPPSDLIHVTSIESFKYYNIRGSLFIIFYGDDFLFKIKDMDAINRIIPYKVNQYIQEYKQLVQKYENINNQMLE